MEQRELTQIDSTLDQGRRFEIKRLKENQSVIPMLILIACLFFGMELFGCQTAPIYEISSYEQIKKELADQPDIIYPDISKYDRSDTWNYNVSLYQGDRRIKNGYEVYSSNTDLVDADLAALGSETTFQMFNLACFSIEYYYDELNPCPPLENNTTYRGIEMKDWQSDKTEIYKENASRSSRSLEYSRFGALGVEFDLNDYRYMVSADIFLTPEELETTTYEQKMERAHAELFVIVDDILDKGGVPK